MCEAGTDILNPGSAFAPVITCVWYFIRKYRIHPAGTCRAAERLVARLREAQQLSSCLEASITLLSRSSQPSDGDALEAGLAAVAQAAEDVCALLPADQVRSGREGESWEGVEGVNTGGGVCQRHNWALDKQSR